MPGDNANTLQQLDELLNRPRQMWLLGAGISKNAGVPLMHPLTDRIGKELGEEWSDDFHTLKDELDPGSHVEHILSQLGNLIEIAEYRRDRKIAVGGKQRSVDKLRRLHQAIQTQLREIIRWGYIPSTDGGEKKVGTSDNPIVSIDNHKEFVTALFSLRRAGLERRPPVALFTTNYDTLLEDALALAKVPTTDGFVGGAMAFWKPDAAGSAFLNPFEHVRSVDAKLYKLHGSIDWYTAENEVVVRRREGVQYPPEDTSRLLVYPQATKYLTTQVEPFSDLFRAFRTALMSRSEGILVVSGYGFGDRHINQEIERALQHPENQLTLIAFVRELESEEETGEEGQRFPGPLQRWLSGPHAWAERVIVVTNRGFYHGSDVRKLTADGKDEFALWTFEGLTAFLRSGPEIVGVDDV